MSANMGSAYPAECRVSEIDVLPFIASQIVTDKCTVRSKIRALACVLFMNLARPEVGESWVISGRNLHVKTESYWQSSYSVPKWKSLPVLTETPNRGEYE